MSKITINGLPLETDENRLKDMFQMFGTIEEAIISKDRDTGKSRGIGFVTFAKEQDATTAVNDMNGQQFDGRTIRVDKSISSGRRAGAGGGYASGGYGGMVE
ncbi:hypothetical protein ABW20_dc0105797 [Dactylellina cionopaga]|nr:hypothetical protein ABW20_dc0105797 [Dactylellina cionopaga]